MQITYAFGKFYDEKNSQVPCIASEKYATNSIIGIRLNLKMVWPFHWKHLIMILVNSVSNYEKMTSFLSFGISGVKYAHTIL